MRTEKEMMDLITNFANNDNRIRIVYMSGSRVNPNATHDKYADFDIVYIVNDIKSFTNNDEWLDSFGERLIMQKPDDWNSHPYDYNSINKYAYLMQFKDGNRIDLTLIDVKNIQAVLEDKEPRKILLSKDKIDGLNDIEVGNYYNIKRPSLKEFQDCCNEFWWISLYIVKGVCRRELMYAKLIYDRYLVDSFLNMINWQVGITQDFGVSTGYCYKYLQRYLSEKDFERLAAVFPNASYSDIQEKLIKICKLFNETSITVGNYFNYKYSTQESKEIMEYIEFILKENDITHTT